MKRTVICPGSFDPVTLGHIDIISRASAMFDKVIVAVLVNSSKKPSFTTEERINLLKKALSDFDNIEIQSFDGLLADYAKETGADAVVRGLRAVSDFEYEFQMSLTNKRLNPDLETIFLTSRAEYMFLSSSIVKQVATLNGDISNFVPECIHDEIKKRLAKNI
ncbi:MAG: pantetheine-phosphate adenylyltransferase [Acutalibacteraceae bacterium]|nr:pantetheine-phosphate adenylyltransferase [Acutalibacteraceae bacterium]